MNAQGATCATAANVNVNGTCITGHTITDSTIESGAQGYNCGGTIVREGWYQFTITSGPQIVSIVAQGNNRNIAIQLLSGACGSLS
ncbi:hypothetical protein [Flavobacterium sp.]|jgi:hypothetical protein|uniref:hypothetical protein n=1 Tax=Flavobacterium sp. TaxID=239 RepID=UPI0022CD1E45|nr:hypothetical protein [Flavobacterium sp.]MCZ8295848.1 hypothetical protein [Flavobacterium sp.]